MTSVLIVEDDERLRAIYADALRSEGFAVREVPLAADTFKALRESVPDVIVLDLGMPRGTLQGMEMLIRLRETEAGRTIPVVILSGFGELVNPDVTRRLGVVAVLTKPLTHVDELASAIKRIRS